MRMLVISHTPHYMKDGQYVGWGPTVRELDYLSQLFDELVHLAPLYPGQAPASALGYQSKQIHLHLVKPSGGNTLSDKITIGKRYPEYARAMLEELNRADIVHVRCPANISLLAILLLSLVHHPKYHWVKYAGNWKPTRKEPWSYRLQRWWLQRDLHRGIVTINGNWINQPRHIYTFPNPCLTAAELREGEIISQQKKLEQPVQILFIGRLEKSKGASRVLEIAKMLNSLGIDFILKTIGDGPERPVCEEFVKKLELNRRVEFLGWLPKTELKNYYRQAHLLLLPTDASEGWPKVLSEGMAYGVVPLAGAVSSIPQILAESEAGLAIPPNQIQDFVKAIQDYLANPEKWKQASLKGVHYAPNFSYDRYLAKIRETFRNAWDLELPSLDIVQDKQKLNNQSANE